MDAEIVILTQPSESQKMTTCSEPSKTLGLGTRLKQAREAINLSEKEVASRLNLSANIIAFLENEQYEQAPPAAFMRGYLKSYARLLNLTEQDIALALNDLAVSLPTHSSKAPSLSPQPVNRHEQYLQWSTYLIILVLVLMVSIWWGSHSRYSNNELASTTTEQATDTSNPMSAATASSTPFDTMTANDPALSTPAVATPAISTPVLSSAKAKSTKSAPLKKALHRPHTDVAMMAQLPEPGLETDD